MRYLYGRTRLTRRLSAANTLNATGTMRHRPFLLCGNGFFRGKLTAGNTTLARTCAYSLQWYRVTRYGRGYRSGSHGNTCRLLVKLAGGVSLEKYFAPR